MNMTERDFWTVQAMRNYGRKFVLAIAGAALVAEDEEYNRLKKAFPVFWRQFEDKGKEMEEKYKTPVFPEIGEKTVEKPVSIV